MRTIINIRNVIWIFIVSGAQICFVKGGFHIGMLYFVIKYCSCEKSPCEIEPQNYGGDSSPLRPYIPMLLIVLWNWFIEVWLPSPPEFMLCWLSLVMVYHRLKTQSSIRVTITDSLVLMLSLKNLDVVCFL